MVTSETEFGQVAKNLKYYAAFQLIFVVMVVIMSSIGAFFHFLLDHEISIVESWLHNNQWEILISSKLFALFMLNRWFKVRLYQLKTFRELVKESISWPEAKAIVISFFLGISYISLGQTVFVDQNVGYWYYQFTSFYGLFLFFGIEFILLAYLEDVLNVDQRPNRIYLSLGYLVIFTLAFRLSVPDYYGLIWYLLLCFSAVIYLSGSSFKNWSNVVCFLMIFVAPMGSLFGLDPVWGDDFSPFKLTHRPQFAFLAVIWMISFLYYQYREQILVSARKLLR